MKKKNTDVLLRKYMKKNMVHTVTQHKTQVNLRTIQDCANHKQDWNSHSPQWTQVIVFNIKHVFSNLEVGYAHVCSRKSLIDLANNRKQFGYFHRDVPILNLIDSFRIWKIQESKVYLQKHIKNRPVVGERNSFKRNPFDAILFLKNKTEQLKKSLTSWAE